MDLDVTRQCNLHCVGCIYHSPHARTDNSSPHTPPHISLETIEDLCSRLKPMGTHSLILQGAGEPFVHPRLVDLVSVVKAAGFHCTVLTNGTLLDQARIEGLIAARLDVLKVSLWATTTEEYIQLYPGCDSAYFERVLEGLQRLSRSKARLASGLPDMSLHFPIVGCQNN